MDIDDASLSRTLIDPNDKNFPQLREGLIVTACHVGLPCHIVELVFTLRPCCSKTVPNDSSSLSPTQVRKIYSNI